MGQLPDILSDSNCGLPKSNRTFVVNPTTDVSYDEFESIAVGTMAMSHTAFRAHVYVDADATTPALLDHDAVWGGTAGVAPALARSSAGVYTLTWDSAYDDLNPTPARQVSHSTNIRFAHVSIAEATAGFIAYTFTANVLTVRTWNSSGTPTDIDFCASVA